MLNGKSTQRLKSHERTGYEDEGNQDLEQKISFPLSSSETEFRFLAIFEFCITGELPAKGFRSSEQDPNLLHVPWQSACVFLFRTADFTH